MLGLPRTTLPTDIRKFKEFETAELAGGLPTSSHQNSKLAPVVQVIEAPTPAVVKEDQLLEKFDSLPKETDASIKSLQELFEQTYAALSQAQSGNHHNTGTTVSHVLLADVKSAFFQLRDKSSNLMAKRIEQEKAVLVELEDLKHKYVLLQAEFQSKFEKDKTISLPIPNKPNRKLFARQDSNDSANSFIPLEGETFEDYKLRELERKAKKLQDALAEGKAAEDSDSDGEQAAIPGIDEPLPDSVPKQAEAKPIEAIKPSSGHKHHDHHNHHDHEHHDHHDHEHHEHQQHQQGRGFCACRRRGEHTHRHLYMDTHQLHYGL